MFKRDYLTRMIEEMGEVIGAVLGLKRQMKHPQAIALLDDLLRKQFRIPLKLLESMPPEQITDLFRMNGSPEPDKLQQAARLLEEAGRLRMELEETKGDAATLMKALYLYVYSDMNGADRTLLQLPERIAEVRLELREYRLTREVDELLARYEEGEGQLAEADNIWFRLIAVHPESFSGAIAFYDRLQLLREEELEQGGLSRQEVEEGRQELLRLRALLPSDQHDE